MNLRRTLLALPLLAFGLTAFAQTSNERGTRAEAKAMADEAVAHVAKVGLQAAAKDFVNDPARWVKKDLYVVAYTFDGVCVAHGVNPKFIGKNLIEVKDQKGRPLIKDFIDAARRQADTWLEIDWAHPVTKKPEPKQMNVRRIAGQDALIAVGYYV